MLPVIIGQPQLAGATLTADWVVPLCVLCASVPDPAFRLVLEAKNWAEDELDNQTGKNSLEVITSQILLDFSWVQLLGLDSVSDGYALVRSKPF